jgi:hypothetical protein
MLRSSASRKRRVNLARPFKAGIELNIDFLGKAAAQPTGAQASRLHERGARMRYATATLALQFSHVPGCTYGTFANNRRSAPLGSSSIREGTLKIIVWRRGSAYNSQRGISLLLGLPARANPMKVSLI